MPSPGNTQILCALHTVTRRLPRLTALARAGALENTRFPIIVMGDVGVWVGESLLPIASVNTSWPKCDRSNLHIQVLGVLAFMTSRISPHMSHLVGSRVAIPGDQWEPKERGRCRVVNPVEDFSAPNRGDQPCHVTPQALHTLSSASTTSHQCESCLAVDMATRGQSWSCRDMFHNPTLEPCSTAHHGDPYVRPSHWSLQFVALPSRRYPSGRIEVCMEADGHKFLFPCEKFPNEWFLRWVGGVKQPSS